MLGKKFKLAKEIVKEAKQVIDAMDKDFLIKEKSAKDLVTEVDVAVENYILNAIRRKYPDDLFLGEESNNQEQDFERNNVWVLDPIDGTCNFVYQRKNYAISLAYVEKGTTLFGIVYDVAQDILYTSLCGHGAHVNGVQARAVERIALNKTVASISHKLIFEGGIQHCMENVQKMFNYRYLGVASLEIIYVALGRHHLYISRTLKPWDYLAAKHFLEACGGIVRTFDNQKIEPFSSTALVAGNRANVNEFFA